MSTHSLLGLPFAPQKPMAEWMPGELAAQSRWARAAGAPRLAMIVLAEALRRHPNHPGILADLAMCHLDAKDNQQANDLLEQACRLIGNSPGVLEQLGQQLLDNHFLEQALAIFRALAMSPVQAAHAVGNARAAVVLWRLGRRAEAEACLHTATLAGGSLPEVVSATALLCKDHDPEHARQLLGKLVNNPTNVPPAFVAASAHALAEVCDKLDDCDAAMTALAQGKQLEQQNPRVVELQAKQADWRVWHQQAPDMANATAGQSTPANDVRQWPRHGFLLGHPRSGTTLIEQSLDGHPLLRSVGESAIYEATISTTLQRIYPIAQGAQPPASTGGTTALNQAREMYFAGLLGAAGNPPADCLLLDKNPALTMAVPWISRALPQSRLIVALRDPRDVCLSAYFQSCQRTAWSSQWLSLADTIGQYAFAMGLWLEMRDKLTQPWIEIRYEDVVAKPIEEGRKLTRFLDLAWHPAQESPAEHARGKIIRSPSHAEVVRPIHPKAIGRWRRYHSHLEPYLPILQPFVEAFGYAGPA